MRWLIFVHGERASQSQARGRRQVCTGIKCSQCSPDQPHDCTAPASLPHDGEVVGQGSPYTSHTLPFIPARLRSPCYGSVAQTVPLKVYSIGYQALHRETNRQQTNSNYLVSLHQNTLAIAAGRVPIILMGMNSVSGLNTQYYCSCLEQDGFPVLCSGGQVWLPDRVRDSDLPDLPKYTCAF